MSFPTIGLKIAGPAGPETLELTEFLGSGAFGMVFKAKELPTGTTYDVKFPQLAPFSGQGELLAFENDVRASSQIRHENVVNVVHVELTPKTTPPYLVMDFIGLGPYHALPTSPVIVSAKI